jgi:lipid-binding SYLF domain-containing protein
VRSVKKPLLIVVLLSLASLRWADTKRESSTDRLDNAGEVLQEIMAAPDNGIPEEVLEQAKCVAVVPHMIKGGFVSGDRHGRGVATRRTANGWSAPAFFALVPSHRHSLISFVIADYELKFNRDFHDSIAPLLEKFVRFHDVV